MNIRVTPQSLLNQQLGYMRRQTDQLAVYQQQAATGLRLNRPSDGPLDTVALMRSQAEEGRFNSNKANVSAARAKLETSNSALLDTTEMLTRARQIALEGANGTSNTDAHEALASELDQIIQRVLTAANSQTEGRYQFGGTATDKPPFVVTSTDTAGRPLAVSYQGSLQRATVDVGPSQQVDMLVTGDEVFKQPGQDVFSELMGLRDELRNTAGTSTAAQTAALTKRVAGLEKAQQAVLGSVGEQSSSLQALESLDARLGDLLTQNQIRQGDISSADLPGVVVQLKTQETLFNATLSVASRISQQSLLDFIR